MNTDGTTAGNDGGLSRAAARFSTKLKDLGYSYVIHELPDSTRTAGEAAGAVGCAVGQIAKSLVFEDQNTGRPLLVIAIGKNRVDTGLLARVVGEPARMAHADFCKEKTGFAIGGVPPAGHMVSIPTEDLLALAQGTAVTIA